MDATTKAKHGGGRPASNPRKPCGHCGEPVAIDSKKRAAYERGEDVYCNRPHRMAAIGRKVTVTCSRPGCGKTTVKNASEIERNKTGRVFCGKECQGRSGSRPRTGNAKPCGHCGEPVYKSPNQDDGGPRFCDQTCWGKYLEGGERVDRVELTCANPACGKVWRLTPDQMRQDVKTCSRECTGIMRRRQPGERYVDPRTGYAWVTTPDGRNIYEHTHVMEQEYGGLLPKGSTVHHKTGGFKGRSNNDLSNLELWTGNHPKGHRVEDVADYSLDHLRTFLALLPARYRGEIAALARDAAALDAGEQA